MTIIKKAILRAALYIRVSSAEQALHGYSLAAQEEFLRQYAKEHKMRIVGIYADEGKSASKRLYQRKELLRMIDDVEAGKIDVIIFKDITRWSRNSSHYHRIQDRIDAAGAYWIAAQQPYLETKTPTGRFQVTVMLGNAQLEAEQTSERIKFVNESRIPKGGVPYGANSCPLGYTVAKVGDMKRMVKDESKAPIVKAFFEHYRTYQSIRGVMIYIADTYGYKIEEKSARKMLKNTIYKGEYKGHDGYCEPYLTPAEFEEIQKYLARRTYTPQQSNRVYLFSSLLKCKECERNLTAYHTNKKGKTYLYYRCKNYTLYKTCTHSKGIREDKFEQWLLDNIADEMEKFVQSVKVEQQAPPPDTEKQRKAIERKMKNLRELYIDGDVEKEEYTQRKADYEEQLASLPVHEIRDTQDIEDFLNSDWKTLYESLTPHEKRAFWRSIIKYIEIDNNLTKRPIFII